MRPTLRTMLVVVAVAAGARAQMPAFGWCPDYLPKANFDMEKYLGTWYENERYINAVEAGSRCVSTKYVMAKDSRLFVDNIVMNRYSGVTRLVKGEIRTFPKEGKLSVKYTTLPYPVETSYMVLDTDYKTYSVVWSCSGLGLFNTQNAWVMTRERNPPPSVLQKAYAVLDKNKIRRLFMMKTDQNDCQNAEPTDENDVQQEEEAPVEEAAEGERSAEAMPAEEAPAKPAETPAKPAEDSPAKPAEDSPAKPAEDAPAKPESDAVRKEPTPEVPHKKPVHDAPKKTAEEPAMSQ